MFKRGLLALTMLAAMAATGAEAQTTIDATQFCQRTHKVRSTILEAVSGATATCTEAAPTASPPVAASYSTNLTASQLAGITKLVMWISADDYDWEHIREFKSGDFNGLTGVTELNLTNQASLTLDGLYAAGVPLSFLGQLTKLVLQDSDIWKIESADYFRGLSRLEVLWIGTNNMVYELPGKTDRPEGTAVGRLINPEAWKHVPNLRYLWIGSNRILTLPRGFFRHLGRLEELNMYDMWYEYHPYGFGSQALGCGIFEGLGRVRKLDIGYNALGAEPIADCFFEGLTGVEEIDLRENPLLETLPRSVLDLPAGVVVRTDPGVRWPSNGANNAPTGAPTVSGTPQAGQTLTADTSTIADADGTAQSTFRYQWIAHDGTDDADIDNATGSSYTLTETEVGKTIKVKVGFTDDKGTSETLTSAATAEIAAAPAATTLSATFPSSRFASANHTGENDVPQVIVEFSEAVASFTKSTPSVTLTGGTISNAQTHTEDGIEHAYIFWVTPAGNADITFTLAAGAACDAGGICTATGTQLTGVPATRTIPGPGGTASEASDLTVSDATATEEDATIDFVVTLDPASDKAVTVDYATANGTATAGSDYTGKSGTLSFSASETSRTVSVAILNDDDVESDETLTLTLSNAANADIEDARGTGTISDDDAASSTTLTASFDNVPDEHDGETSFNFNVAFTTDVAIGYASMRDDAFTATQGDVTAPRRVNGRSDRWEITVEPDGDEDVTITLPANRACTTTGAICSKGDNPVQLRNTASATVAGPTQTVTTTPTVSITGGSGTEGDDEEIDFTITLDEAASTTVTVDYQTSDGTAEAGDDYTTKSGTLTFSAGETSKTISVAIEDDIENESDETFTVTLSNPSGADLGTSSATGTIENRYVAPLTARFENMPSEHDGSEFTFELHFSESPEVPYRRLRDRSFSLVQADVIRAQRQNPQAANRNQSWTITVEPLGTGQIGITLPAAVSCTDDKSICAHDGRKLSHSTSATVAGPPSISVADATVTEAAGAVLAFTVSLSRSSGNNVTVDYATSDGTATAGADYTATSGTLTISAGSTSASIDVPVLDDAHDNDDETLTLSNPTNAVLDDATATGTIDNNDAMPRALMARFGRTAAVHVIDQIEERIEAPRRPGFDGRIAGRNVDRNIGRDFALGFLRQLGGGAGYGGMSRGRQAMPGRASQATSATHLMQPHGAGRTGTGNAAPMGAGRPGAGAHQQNGMTGLGFSQGQVLTGSSFAMNRGTKNGGVLSVWSRSAQSRFHGREGLLALNGDVVTSTVGADYAKGRMVSGVAVAHSRGTGGYSGEHRGAVSSAITGVYPWIGYEASERISVWTVAGYGGGGLLLSPEAGSPIETGLSMAMAAGGGRGRIAGSERGFSLAFKADALWVGTRSEQAHTAGGRLNGTTATVTRLRTALEGAKNVALSKRMSLRTTVETGIRQDGGDAETGAGIDVGAGLALNDAGTGLTVNVQVRTLVVHQAAGFSERGVAVSVSYDPAPKTPLGFAARVAPAWGGDAMSGAEALWGRETMAGMGQYGMPIGGSRLDTEVGYGLPLGGRFVGTPRVGVRRSEYGQDYRLGYGVDVIEQGNVNLQLGIDAERRVNPVFGLRAAGGAADQRVLSRASVSW